MKITNVDVVLVDRPAFSPAFVWRKGVPGSDGPITTGWLLMLESPVLHPPLVV